jgi:hypothetical protein
VFVFGRKSVGFGVLVKERKQGREETRAPVQTTRGGRKPTKRAGGRGWSEKTKGCCQQGMALIKCADLVRIRVVDRTRARGVDGLFLLLLLALGSRLGGDGKGEMNRE